MFLDTPGPAVCQNVRSLTQNFRKTRFSCFWGVKQITHSRKTAIWSMFERHFRGRVDLQKKFHLKFCVNQQDGATCFLKSLRVLWYQATNNRVLIALPSRHTNLGPRGGKENGITGRKRARSGEGMRGGGEEERGNGLCGGRSGRRRTNTGKGRQRQQK